VIAYTCFALENLQASYQFNLARKRKELKLISYGTEIKKQTSYVRDRSLRLKKTKKEQLKRQKLKRRRNSKQGKSMKSAEILTVHRLWLPGVDSYVHKKLTSTVAIDFK